ncbi:discoidin domain-containing protein [Cellulosimicrobium marinum]|uniref:discoidin domain-containing protein n=1 Tax=Cellulosimicrobium marinum TaxID=1638992 RepID=UPI001E4717FE|nr:discoidin domain-containing protein [Cellulosimicrobium marinum]MCB7135074.1 discoidin domain-containing protein [Cellulosimicrobium marinum]
MTPTPAPTRRRSRRRRPFAAVLATAALLLPGGPALADTTSPSTDEHAYGAPDAIAADFYGALLRHTRWVESVWDESAGVYQSKDMNFAVVLGNAVLLTHGEYDAEVAGVSEDELRAQTIATIEHYAATNRFVDPAGTWGKKLFWDSTFQSYFLDAGRLMWDELDATTRDNLTTIAVEQSRYTADLDFGKDPLSGSWTADWPTGKHEGDTAQEEAGVYTQALAPGLAWVPEDPDASRWAEQLGDWGRNAAGQPTADRNNPAVVAGEPVSTNTMQTIYDTYLVENHGSFGPHYQSDIWRSGARNAIHFLLNDEPLPEILTRQPNSAELWESIKMVMSEQGEPFMPMVADREFLYGRDVLPMAFLGQVLRDPDAARAEAGLAAALEDYQAYAPVDRLTKFSGEPKYEPEARAEIAISYLLHVEAAEHEDGPVVPTPEDEFFAGLEGVRDFGEGPGLTVQQSDAAWAAAGSKKGFVKFPWVPGHDSWLFHVSGSTPYLYPTTGSTVDERHVTTYTEPRDGFEGTSSVFRIGDGYAGQVTLPTGSAVYASTGAGPDDANLSVRNLDMGGYSGLDGSRTYTTADGETTASLPVTRPADPADANAARVDDLAFDPVEARYVRVLGQQGNARYGYSVYALHAYADEESTTDLAAGRPASASSEDAGSGRTAARVTDGNPSTRWAVAVSERTRPDSWLQVDLGEQTTVGAVRVAWEASAGLRYLVQTSDDGVTWETQTAYGKAPADVNVSRLDTVDLVPAGADEPAPVTTRYVRMQGVRGNPEYGYSLYHLRAFAPDGTDVAAGRPATASSADGSHPASAVTDGSASSRWAVSRDDRTRPDSWVQVDLGEPVDVAQVQLGWESAAGQEYRVQTSLDGETWHDAARFRYTGDLVLESSGDWLNVEGEAGFVVRGSDAPISVSKATQARHVVRLADGSTGPRLVEMVPGDAAATAAQAARAVPTTDADGVHVSVVDGYLVAFNLTASDVAATVTVPHDGDAVRVYVGTQRVGAEASTLDVDVPAGDAVVLAPRATVALQGGGAPAGVTVAVPDARTVRLVAGDRPVRVEVRNTETGAERSASATPSGTTVRFADATAFPVADLALSTLTFPASVLPEGMTSPALAVDGDASTAWVPGPDGRMVVDLGRSQEIGEVVTAWAGGGAPASVVSVSDDGLTFTDVGELRAGAPSRTAEVGVSARYVALNTTWQEGDPALTALRVLAPGTADPGQPEGVHVGTTAEPRCLAGRPYVAVRVVNDDDVALDVEVATPFGSRTFTSVAPGANAYQSFAVRGAATGDTATVTARPSEDADERESVVTTEVEPPAC